MGGFHDTLLSRIVGMNGHVVVYHQDGAIKDFDYLIEKMKDNKVVAAATTDIVPVLEGQVMISANGNNSGAMVRGIRMSDLQHKFQTGTKIYGTPISDVKDGQLVMGAALSRNLRLTQNDPATLISANGGTATAFGTIPRIQSYPVATTFFAGMYEYDSGYIFMPLETAQKFLDSSDGVSHIDLFFNRPKQNNPGARCIGRQSAHGIYCA